MSPAPLPSREPAAPAGLPARLRRLLTLVCGALLVLAVLGTAGAAAGPPGAGEARPASAPADPAGETHEPGPAEAALPGRARYRRTGIRPARAPRRARPDRRAAACGAPAPVPAPRPAASRRVVMRC
ncbi:hypothetical protein ACVW0K_005879 [Streptomyces filamentosus]